MEESRVRYSKLSMITATKRFSICRTEEEEVTHTRLRLLYLLSGSARSVQEELAARERSLLCDLLGLFGI